MKKRFLIIIISFIVVYNFSFYASLKTKINDFKNLEEKLVILENYKSSNDTNVEYNQLLQKYESYYASLAYIPPAHEKNNEVIIKSKKNEISIILQENGFFISRIKIQLIVATIILISYITFSIIILLRKKLKVT